MNWYYSREGERIGPISPSELRAMAASGQLVPDDQVWRPGLKGWIKASALKGIVFSTDLPTADVRDFEIEDGVQLRKDESSPNTSVATFLRRSKRGSSWPAVVAGTIAFAFLLAYGFYLAKSPLSNGNRPQIPVDDTSITIPEVLRTVLAFVFVSVIGVVALAFYMLPTIIAKFRGHPNFAPIAALNILLGFTFLGWVAALVWAFTEVQSRDHRHYHYPTIK